MSQNSESDKDVASKPVVLINISIDKLIINRGIKNPFASLWSWGESFFVIFLSFFVIFLNKRRTSCVLFVARARKTRIAAPCYKSACAFL